MQYQGRWEVLDKTMPTLQQAGINPASLPRVHTVFNLVAPAAILVITAILLIGIRESANFNSVMVLLKISIVLVFVGVERFA